MLLVCLLPFPDTSHLRRRRQEEGQQDAVGEQNKGHRCPKEAETTSLHLRSCPPIMKVDSCMVIKKASSGRQSQSLLWTISSRKPSVQETFRTWCQHTGRSSYTETIIILGGLTCLASRVTHMSLLQKRLNTLFYPVAGTKLAVDEVTGRSAESLHVYTLPRVLKNALRLSSFFFFLFSYRELKRMTQGLDFAFSGFLSKGPN